MSNISQLDRLIKTSATPIHLIRCNDEYGRPSYYFLMAPIHAIKTLQQNKTGILNLTSYGKIIISGFGAEPSEEIKTLLKEKYSFNADSL